MPNHTWMVREENPDETYSLRQKVVSALWQKYNLNTRLSHGDVITQTAPLQNFLSHCMPKDYAGNGDSYAESVKNNFALAINKENYQQFYALFDSLTFNQLVVINNGEKLALDIPQYKVPVISETSLQHFKEYLDDSRCSAVVSIRSEGIAHTLMSEGNMANKPFCILSVGKVFTGVLTMLMVRNNMLSAEAFSQSIQLAPAVLEKLSAKVKQRLRETTLLEVMTHQSGLGDYITHYSVAIQLAHTTATPIPNIQTCHDFLAFADEDVSDTSRYSNLGLLLVGLAIEYAYHLKTGQDKPYEDILREFIIDPAGISLFRTHKPHNGQYNQDDSIAPHIVGSPAGGYWTTVDDLQNFGDWINKKCQSDPVFLHLVEAYGQEFYSRDKREIVHHGSIESASAFLVTALDSGTTVAVLADQANVAMDLTSTIIKQSTLDNMARAAENLQPVGPLKQAPLLAALSSITPAPKSGTGSSNTNMDDSAMHPDTARASI